VSKAKRRQPPRAKPAPLVKKRPTISACLIVKNEADNLDRCLNSLQGKVDEIIVVDTGSTDGSIEIAQRHGARTSTFTWCDDFAAARNASIEQAQGDWVLWIDADEELFEDPPGAIRQLVDWPDKPEGFLVTCRNLTDTEGQINSQIRQWRLFQNHLGLRFHGRIHEHLVHADGSTEVNLLFQDAVWIRHWGYIPDPERTPRKRMRNASLLQLALEDDPNDPFTHYNIGKQFAAHREFEPGLQALQKAIELWQARGRVPQAYVGNMFALAINAALELGNNQLSVDIEAQVPESVVSPDILFQAGVAWMRLGKREEAYARLMRAWQDTSIRLNIEGDPASCTWRPLAALAQMHLDSGEPEKAYEFAKQALPYGAELPNLLYAMAVSSASLHKYDESIAWARKIIALDDINEGYRKQARRLMYNIGQGTSQPGLMVEALASGEIEGIDPAQGALTVAQTHASLGDVQQQYETLDAACREYPENAELRLALAGFLEEQGHAAEATNVLGGGLDYPAPPLLYARLAALLTKQGRLEDAANALAVVERSMAR